MKRIIDFIKCPSFTIYSVEIKNKEEEWFSDKIYFLTFKKAEKYGKKFLKEFEKDGYYINCIGGETVFL